VALVLEVLAIAVHEGGFTSFEFVGLAVGADQRRVQCVVPPPAPPRLVPGEWG